VPGVGQQRHRPRRGGDDDLHDHEAHDQDQRDPQVAGIGAGRHPVLVPGAPRGSVPGLTLAGGIVAVALAARRGLATAFTLIEAAQAGWRAVNAPHLVALVRAGATFTNGILLERPEADQPSDAGADQPEEATQAAA